MEKIKPVPPIFNEMKNSKHCLIQFGRSIEKTDMVKRSEILVSKKPHIVDIMA
jgi:hypothetical protein